MKEAERTSRSLRSELTNALGDFARMSRKLSLGASASFKAWPGIDPYVKDNRYVDGAEMLASAALSIVREMLARLPLSKDPHASLLWRQAARTLGAWFAHTGLWNLVLGPQYQNPISTWSNLVAARHPPQEIHWLSEIDEPYRTVLNIYYLFGNGLPSQDRRYLFYMRHYVPFPDLGDWLIRLGEFGEPRGDVLSALQQIPLPIEYWDLVGSELGGRASLYHVLTAFAGAPASFIKHAQGLIDFVLLASAFVVAGAQNHSLSYSAFTFDTGIRNGATGVTQVAVDNLAASAWAWLSEHLPKVVFAEPVEKTIGKAKYLSYLQSRSAT